MDYLPILIVGILVAMFGKRPLKIDRNGINLIKQFEGFSSTIYLDAAGLPTIGYGHLIKNDEDFSGGITEDDATKLMYSDLSRFESSVNRLVTVPLSQSQFNALVSFTYNVGVSAFENSTLLKVLNAGDYIGATEQLTRWDIAGGRKLSGLTTRRKLEQEVFLS